MSTVKLIFKPSSVGGKEGSVFLRLIHSRKIRLVNTGLKILPEEWDADNSSVIIPPNGSPRLSFLLSISSQLDEAVAKARKAVAECEAKGSPFSVDDLVAAYAKAPQGGFVAYGQDLCSRLLASGAARRAENYSAALKRFSSFLKDGDVDFNLFNADLLLAFESKLKDESLTPNSTSFYMRNLRAVFNRAVEEEMTSQTNPFRHVFTGVAKTVKRAIPLSTIKEIRDIDLASEPLLDMARDIFIMSFLTRGMSIVDLAHLKKTDLKESYLHYRRKKTGQMLVIKWERQMREIVDKYSDPDSPYLLPIINNGCSDTRKRYRSQAALINRRLKEVGARIGLAAPLTLYVARHSWASAAFANNIPISIISEGMGHDSEKTTRIYLASLDTTAVDTANNKIINLI